MCVPIVTPTVGRTCIEEHALTIKQLKRTNINLFIEKLINESKDMTTLN